MKRVFTRIRRSCLGCRHRESGRIGPMSCDRYGKVGVDSIAAYVGHFIRERTPSI